MLKNKNIIILFYPKSMPDKKTGRIPYALLYLERMVRDLDVEVILIDESVNQDYKSIIQKYKNRILAVGVSAMTGYQITGGIKFSKFIKNISSDILVVWGGWHVTLLPEQTLKKQYIDLGVLGQGEDTFRQLVLSLINKKDYKNIFGLAFKQEDKVVVNSFFEFKNINEFPKINYDLIDINEYVFKSAYSDRCIGYFASHGCVLECSFCCVSHVYKKKWYCKNIDDIIFDIKYLKEIAHIDSITFDDDNFFVNKNFALEFAKRLIQEKINILWDTSAHAGIFLKLFNNDDVKLFYDSGCRQIYIGAESGNKETFKLLNKKSDTADNLKFVRVLKQNKIMPMFSVMLGFPFKPEADIYDTFNMVREAKLIDSSLRARMFFYTPYPGTELYKTALEKGFKPPLDLLEWQGHTLRKFKAPWIKKDYAQDLEIFANFYVPLANPCFYKFAPNIFLKIPAFFVNKLFYPIIYLRFRFNFFKFPIEAKIFLKILYLFNKFAKTNISLGFESYV